MKYFLTLWIVWFLPGGFLANKIFAQPLVSLTEADLDEHQFINLSRNVNWRFHSGNQSNYPDTNLNTSRWEKMNPMQITNQLMDEEGNIEGWFRFSLVIDSSLYQLTNVIQFSNFGQAVDMYVNGELIQSFGQTGFNGELYQRSQQGQVFLPFQFQPNKEFVFAFHYVHESLGSPLNYILKRNNFAFGFGIGTDDYMTYKQKRDTIGEYSFFFIVSVCFILTSLFLILWFQNPRDKDLRLIVFSSSLFFITSLLTFVTSSSLINFISYSTYLLLDRLVGILAALMVYSIILIFAQVFTNALPKRHWFIVLLTSLLAIGFTFIQIPQFEGSLLLIFLFICISYIVKFWGKVHGSQWSIVVGFLATLIAMISFFALFLLTDRNNQMIANFVFLSFPFSLLFYVSIRFKEFFKEVQDKANEVLRLTEEKRQQAIIQQEILEKKVEERTAELNQSLEALKATQTQLIQSEKLASLGELTAGIAHEIQNPLNFINNFSEINQELSQELEEDLKTRKYEEVISLSKNIRENSIKITQHGKRADAIVKNMLQHSRSSSGEKQLTDINVLCDEYLRLAYHGYRAKDHSFNGEITLDLDPSLPKIMVVPQDIGRVLLNLINNAFQALSGEAIPKVDPNYIPRVTVSTKKLLNQIEITITDNGPGIPEEIKDKIFHPFFTTKPAGQGTGLGLSLAYDIVKAHGGEITVDSTKQKETEFIITLPEKS